ncbi:MAG: response regulator, partial [Thermoproteota archaeon]
MTDANGKLLIPPLSDLLEKRQIRVLHMDDDRGFLKTASQMLELQGFEVDTVTSVEEALKKLTAESFDVVVSDYLMPDRNGLEFLEELRERGSRVPFIVFTGKGKEEVAMRALNLGADRYLQKHGDPETVYGELAHSIRKAVERLVIREKLREREKRMRVFLEGFQGIAYQVRPGNPQEGGFKTLMFQGNVEEITGYSGEEFLTGEKSWSEVIHPDDLPFVLREGRNLLSDPGYVADEEYRILHRNGETRWVRDISRPSQTGGMLQGTIYDITEQKKKEQELRREREILEKATQNVGAGLAIISRDFRVLWANQLLREAVGDVEGELCYQVYM